MQTNLQVVYEGDFIILCVQYCAVNLLQMPLRVCCGKTSSYKLVKKDFFCLKFFKCLFRLKLKVFKVV